MSLNFGDSFETLRTIGRPIPLMLEKQLKDEYKFDRNELEKMLCSPRVANKKVVVISIIGTIRCGKSFLMNFVLKYLLSKCRDSWLSNLDQSLEGFSWNNGLNRNTVGIMMWSEPFVLRIHEENVAVILLDTQGMFSRFNSTLDCTTIASLSLLMSSYQLIILDNLLDEPLADFVEVFVNYAHMIVDQWSMKNPFQNVMGVIRDWLHPAEHSYGLHGGELFFNNWPSSKFLNTDHLSHKKYYKGLFHKMQCFLMPHPGIKASNNLNFDGRVRDLEPLFQDYLKVLIPSIFSIGNLPPKTINGHCLTCKELFYYFDSLICIINNHSFPSIQDIITENGNLNKWEMLEQMHVYYLQQMDKFFENEGTFISEDKMLEEHQRISRTIRGTLEKAKKFNDTVIFEDLQTLTSAHLKSLQSKFGLENSNKNIKMGIFTPYALVLLLGVAYIGSHFLSYLQIKLVDNICGVLFYLSLVFVLVWIVTCCWQLEEISAILDEVADILIIYVLNPASVMLKNRPAVILTSLYDTLRLDEEPEEDDLE